LPVQEGKPIGQAESEFQCTVQEPF